MTSIQLYREFVAGFEARKFSAGLLIAFIDLLLALDVPKANFKDFDEFLARHARRTTTGAGKRANTLIVDAGDGHTLSLRPFYNEAETFFRSEHKRFDYPSCAPHATQAWADYRGWLDALVTFSDKSLKELRTKVADFVLETLKSQAFDPGSVVREPPLFQRVLEEFELTAHKGEPTGAAYQGIVFGFLRADNPHLQVEIDKVRTGSKRLQRVGDIDAWEGARLAISAEVKQYTLSAEDVDDLAGFIDETGRRGAIGMVVVLGFREGARAKIEALGARALDRDDLQEIVALWDPMKQRTAVASFVYYCRHVEKNSFLADRVDAFLKEIRSKEQPS
jgi:hypothetical protein